MGDVGRWVNKVPVFLGQSSSVLDLESSAWPGPWKRRKRPVPALQHWLSVGRAGRLAVSAVSESTISQVHLQSKQSFARVSSLTNFPFSSFPHLFVFCNPNAVPSGLYLYNFRFVISSE